MFIKKKKSIYQKKCNNTFISKNIASCENCIWGIMIYIQVILLYSKTVGKTRAIKLAHGEELKYGLEFYD